MPAASSRPPPPLPGQASLLLVDDNPAHLLVLEGILSPLGQRMVQASSGGEALRRVLDEDFAAILLDIRLGDMTGVEVLSLLRERERNRRTPVLLLTAADSDERAVVAAYNQGAVDYLRKPVIPEVLRAKVSVFVELYLAREAIRRQEEAERERERMELRIANQEMLHHLLVQAPAGIAITRGPEFVFEFANPLYEKLAGRRIPLGKPLREVLPEVISQPQVMGALRQVMETGEPFRGTEFPVALDRHGTGKPEESFFNLIYQPTRDMDGEVSGILTFAIEVTEWVRARQKAEQLAGDLHRQQVATNESEERLRLAVAATELGTWDLDLRTQQLRWDARCKALFGLPPDADVTYELFLSGLHAEDRERTHQAVLRSQDPAGTGGYDIEYRTVGLRDGVERWCRATGRTFFEGGQPVRFVGTIQEITERKRAEDERTRLLAGERQRAEQLRGLARAAVALNAASGVQAALDIITTQARALIGAHQSIVSLTVGEDWTQSITAVSLSDKYAAWRDYDEKPDGSGIYGRVLKERRPLRMTQAELEAHPAWKGFGKHAAKHPPMRGWLAVPLLGSDGKSLGLIQLSDKHEGDFTEEDEAIVVQLAQMASVAVENARLYEEIRRLNSGLERRVRERTTQLQEVNRELESFSYSVSHDLRTPLRHIAGFAQLLERRAAASLDDSARDYLKTIINAARQGDTLVEDLLAFSRMGRAELRHQQVDLAKLVDEVRRELEADTAGREVEWRVGALPVVEADLALLRQVVRNLLGNALKYTRTRPRAVIEVGAREVEGEVEVWVRDNGVGFEEGAAGKLFGVFQRLHSSEEFEGTGIGLANVRRIISRHGGRTWAQGTVDQGATFSFSLPRNPTSGT